MRKICRGEILTATETNISTRRVSANISKIRLPRPAGTTSRVAMLHAIANQKQRNCEPLLLNWNDLPIIQCGNDPFFFSYIHFAPYRSLYTDVFISIFISSRLYYSYTMHAFSLVLIVLSALSVSAAPVSTLELSAESISKLAMETTNSTSAALEKRQNYSGQGTYFYQNGNPGSCGNYNSDNYPLVALSSSQVNSGSFFVHRCIISDFILSSSGRWWCSLWPMDHDYQHSEWSAGSRPNSGW